MNDKKITKKNSSNKKSGNLAKKHDALFKQVMSNPKAAQSFLTSYLPKEILDIVDLSDIKQEKNDYCNDILGEGITDLLYSVKFSNKEGYISILLEHQSRVDKDMPLRILKYIIRICDEHKKKYPKAKLPVIYPVIYYTGSKAYNSSTLIFDLFDNPDLAKNVLLSPVQLVDLSKISDEDLRKQAYTNIMLLAHKYASTKKTMAFIDMVRGVFNASGESEIDLIILKDVVSYLLNVGESYNEDAEEVIQEVASILPGDIKEEIMSIAEQLIDKGWNQGVQQGMQQGVHQGVLKVCEGMIREGVDENIISRVTGLSLEEIRQIHLKNRR